jgi:hypothetical protein
MAGEPRLEVERFTFRRRAGNSFAPFRAYDVVSDGVVLGTTFLDMRYKAWKCVAYVPHLHLVGEAQTRLAAAEILRKYRASAS